jgi:hypothetical protein
MQVVRTVKKDNLDNFIHHVNEIIEDKKKHLEECDQELDNWIYSFTVRTALMHYK